MGDVSDARSNSPPCQARVKRALKDTVLVACALQIRCRRALYPVSFHIKQQKKLRACNVVVMASVKELSYQQGD